MPWRYAEPPYTSMPSYRMTGIRFAIGGIGAGASRQRRRPLHRSISRHSGHPVTSPSTTPPADECHAASDGQQHDRPLTATRPWRTGHAGSAGHHAGRAALPSCRHPTRWAQSARHHLARSAYPAPSALPWPSRCARRWPCCRPCLRQHVLSRFRRVHRTGHLDGIGHVAIHTVRGRHAGQRLEFGILFHCHVIHAGEHRRDRVGGRNRLLLIQRSIKTSNDTPLYQNMSTRKTEEHHLPGNAAARERRRHQLRHARSAQHNRHMQS